MGYRQGPVITLGHPGSIFWRTREPLKGDFGGQITGAGHKELRESYKNDKGDTTRDSWQVTEMGALPELLTDDEGLFTNVDGSVAPVVHQFDRFGVPIFNWVRAFGEKRKMEIPTA